jgi:hypothetical protein
MLFAHNQPASGFPFFDPSQPSGENRAICSASSIRRKDMKPILNIGLALAVTAFVVSPAYATGLATCNSGPQEKWQSQDKLKKQLEDKKWQVRRIKVDGGCYEVYGIDDKGKKVEAYFHPLTLEPVPTGKQ